MLLIIVYLDRLGLIGAHPWSFPQGLPVTGQLPERSQSSTRKGKRRKYPDRKLAVPHQADHKILRLGEHRDESG